MGASEILDLMEWAATFINKLRAAWSAAGLDPAAFDAAVAATDVRLAEQAKLDGATELAGAGGAGA